jgi:hypothetical protein
LLSYGTIDLNHPNLFHEWQSNWLGDIKSLPQFPHDKARTVLACIRHEGVRAGGVVSSASLYLVALPSFSVFVCCRLNVTDALGLRDYAPYPWF